MFLRSSKWRFCHVCHQTGVGGGVVMFRPNSFGAWPENPSLGDPNNPWFKRNNYNVTCKGGFCIFKHVNIPPNNINNYLPKAKSQNPSRIGGWNEILSFFVAGHSFQIVSVSVAAISFCGVCSLVFNENKRQSAICIEKVNQNKNQLTQTYASFQTHATAEKTNNPSILSPQTRIIKHSWKWFTLQYT